LSDARWTAVRSDAAGGNNLPTRFRLADFGNAWCASAQGV